MKYRKKPIVIEAFRLGMEAAPEWYPYRIDSFHGVAGTIVPTLEGQMLGGHGDYIIRGIEGEIYPCKAEIFEKTYEPA